MNLAPRIETERLTLTLMAEKDADDVRAYRLRNRDHLAPWEPLRAPDYDTLSETRKRLRQTEDDADCDRAVSFAARWKDSQEIIAMAAFSNIARGPFQSCTLGYSVDAGAEGQGVMYEALDAAIEYAFNDLSLHRVQAGCVPENARSLRLLDRLGFEEIGLSRDYLRIAGRWRDHILFARVNPSMQ